MFIICLLIFCLVVMAFNVRGTPKPPSPASSTEDQPPEIDMFEFPHPWSSGVPGEIDDFAGPLGLYGPGTDEDKGA